MRKILLALSLFTFSIASFANEPLYQVELLFFSHHLDTNSRAEIWPQRATLPTTWYSAQSITSEATHENIASSLFTLLPEQDKVLRSAYLKLENTADYQPIGHIAWQQMITERKKTVRFVAGKNYRHNKSQPSLFKGFAHFFDSSQQKETFDVWQDDSWQIRGLLSLNEKRFHEVELNVIFQIPTNSQGLIKPNSSDLDILNPYPIKTFRKVRENELHYFDHPLFGILLKITPIQTDTE